ncbi:CDP-diacylglycerol--glycerol-3-phosphate 3-phosphatidyltransferase [Paenibacillus gallinarum]|uniref:CDP-diacylglycerol--glycerol-3-phosphate 3-phosphatidyltransferase n=1 Tax=Paenibacillus gallinarum TaxID=2762232 RepID=A0ABR8STD9_9BACL|nr:CDP-diacylglycerol--glycerol-3-phosphate 3-phosphatidyltransferase [Paenibacillus gallinarum]MBD7966766.1 CDP-diacylglycerol--glycerol-3-phosphate 3-phosphatidyltransferase [Paenibacillus gallinarum]
MNLANRITIARITMIPLFMLCFYFYSNVASSEQAPIWTTMSYVLTVFLFVLAAGTDKLDGYVARKYNQITNLGKLLDPLADKLLISAALIMMAEAGMVPGWMTVIIIGREFAITALRMAASARGIALPADQFGKIKMVLQVIAITAVLLHNFPFRLFTSFPVDQAFLAIATFVTLLSGCNYIIRNLSYLKN